MSTQYNEIGAAFGEMSRLPGQVIVELNVEAALKPLAPGTKILDLACGLGRYSIPLVSEWGAEYVLGVDISSTMVEEARKAASTIDECKGKIEFKVGDCSKPEQYPQGPFDLVLGIWFLNYAPDYATQLGMWKNIAVNLKPKGRVVALVPFQTENPTEHQRKCEKERPFGEAVVAATVLEELEDGVKCRITACVKPQPVVFDQFHLKKSIYECAAREAGMQGELDWQNLKILDHMKDHPMVSLWQTFMRVPHASILIVSKT